MSELRGLTAICRSQTLHAIEAAPELSEFASAEEWRRAHEAWYGRTHFWRVVWSVTGSDPRDPEDAEPGEWQAAS